MHPSAESVDLMSGRHGVFVWPARYESTCRLAARGSGQHRDARRGTSGELSHIPRVDPVCGETWRWIGRARYRHLRHDARRGLCDLDHVSLRGAGTEEGSLAASGLHRDLSPHRRYLHALRPGGTAWTVGLVAPRPRVGRRDTRYLRQDAIWTAVSGALDDRISPPRLARAHRDQPVAENDRMVRPRLADCGRRGVLRRRDLLRVRRSDALWPLCVASLRHGRKRVPRHRHYRVRYSPAALARPTFQDGDELVTRRTATRVHLAVVLWELIVRKAFALSMVIAIALACSDAVGPVPSHGVF